MMRIAYVGHATVQIEARGARLVTDPVLRGRVAYIRRIVPLPKLDALREPDAVLISHAHVDHLDLPSLRLLEPRATFAPQGCGRLLARAGLREVTEVTAGERLRVGAIELNAIALPHDGRRHPFSGARDTLAFVIEGHERALFAADTELFEGLSALAGTIDAALLPIWGWGARLPRGHMNPAQAARATALIAPRVAIPIHWGTLASPAVPWRADPGRPAREFEREVAVVAPAVEVRVLPPGGSTDVVREGSGASG